MQRFEYKVVPAPRKGEKARGLKTTEDRYAHALARVMNEMAREGWDYLRSDTLPVEERSGLTGSRTVFQTMLIFAKPLAAANAATAAPILMQPAVVPTRPDSPAASSPVAPSGDLGGASKLAAPGASAGHAAPSLGPAKAAE